MPTRIAIAATTVLVAWTCAGAAAQVSEYFVHSGDQATFSVLQGGVLLRSWGIAPGTAQYQYPIAVIDTIRTMGANESDIGAEYDLFGNDLGARYTHPPGPTRSWDGTTDGIHNYAIDTGGRVYRYDRDWSNPVLLFSAGGLGALTYDPTNDSLWVGQFSATTVVNYSMAGVALSSFDTGHSQNMALALDHADNTLWLHDRTQQGTFEQWTKTGQMLNRVAVPGMAGQNALAGEFAFVLPGCVGDLDGDGDTDLADLGILLADFGCPQPGPCVGDLDGDGDTDLADLGILLADFGCEP